MISLAELASLFDQVWTGAAVPHPTLCTDTRELRAGDVFVALQGEQFDGHDFLAQAAQRGAIAALVRQPMPDAPLPTLVVGDTTLALQRIATRWRARSQAQVVAITGSCGKTSTRALLASILAECGPTLASEKSFNNHLGVPLTLLRIRPDHRYVVVEIGTNHPGEIAPLVEIAQPHAAVITNVGPSHLEGLGSVAGVAREKADIYRTLRAGHTAVINEEDAFATTWKQSLQGPALLTFGFAPTATVRALDYVEGLTQSCFTLVTPQGQVAVVLPLLGKHNVYNALAAAALALALGVPLTSIAIGLSKAKAEARRLVTQTGCRAATIIDDSYNANPASVKAAIAVLAAYPGRRVLVLGDMLELGSDSEHYHREIGVAAKDAGIDYLFAFGPRSVASVAAFGKHAAHYADHAALADAVKPLLNADATVLVKGSNSMGMHQVTRLLLQE